MSSKNQTMDMKRHKNEQITVISEYYLVVFVKLYRFKFYQSSGKREYLFL